MLTSQAGIFALGTSSHAYLEFDLQDEKRAKEFASTIAAIREPRTTTGGVNFVIGFRPELWRDVAPHDAPPGVEGFNREIRGTEGFVMPSTQHDALVWLSGSALDAPAVALLPEGVAGAVGSALLVQKWRHLATEWEALTTGQQERVMGRSKLDSVELEDKPAESHVARTDQDEFGDIFRRNMPYDGGRCGQLSA